MPKTNFQYDESGNTFYYFLLTFLGIILFPSTYYFWPQEEKVDPEKKKKYQAQAEKIATLIFLEIPINFE